MSCTQSIFLGLLLTGNGDGNGRTVSAMSQSYPHVSQVNVFPSMKLVQNKAYTRFVYNSWRRRHERLTAVYAFGGKENETSKNETFSWESLKKAMGGFRKELTVQDMLREHAKGFDGDGGDGNSGGGGGGAEDEGFAGTLEEMQQVVLAVLGIIFLGLH